MQRAFPVLFLLCATALELHLALMVVNPVPYLRCLNLAPISLRMRLFCALLLLVVLGIQYAGLTRAI